MSARIGYRLLGTAAALCLASAAMGAPITYIFSVTATSGPLSGTSASGTFAYDSSTATPGFHGGGGFRNAQAQRLNALTQHEASGMRRVLHRHMVLLPFL